MSSKVRAKKRRITPSASSPKKAPRDVELEAGSTVFFDDPVYYEHAYRSRVEDIAYYVGVASRRGAVLEYGIGTGRVALPIARAGVEVVGIDRSKPMLRELRARLAKETPEVRDRVELRAGDIRKVRTGRRFPLVTCPFSTALQLYRREEIEAWLARVREHLEPEGEFVFDVAMPVIVDLADPPGTWYETPPVDHPSLGRVNYREYFTYDALTQVLHVTMCFRPPKAPEIQVPLALRQLFPQEIEALLHYNGFESTDVFGDFERGVLTADSDVMVWHAKLRGARRRRGASLRCLEASRKARPPA